MSWNRDGRAALRVAVRSLSFAVVVLAACHAQPSSPPARAPVTLTYLGVAGWQLDAGDHTLLLDPYFSRPADLDAPITPDAAAIAAHAPARADLIMVGHSHVDHLLDAPAVAQRTGAQLMGSLSTARVGKASGLPDDKLIPIRGGEDYAFDGFSVRVIPSLHSALDDKHTLGTPIDDAPVLPLAMDGYHEGGTFGYLVRIAGHEILFLGTANFIERELDGLRPDIAVIAPGLRGEIHDYTCRLLRAIGKPPRVYVTHFDDWQHAPADEAPSDDVRAFVAEVEQCAPGTTVVVPTHFAPMVVR